MLTQKWDMEKALEVRYIEGFEKGLSQGAEQANTEIARRMLAGGMTLDIISRCTELPIEKIKHLTPLTPDNSVQLPQ